MKKIYQGRVIDLNMEEILLPNGKKIDLEIIKHSGASAVVPLRENGNVIMVSQYRHAAGGMIYEIPAGKLNPGEEPLDCAKRELEEETGYIANNYEKLTTIFTSPGFCNEKIHLFLGQDLNKGTQKLEVDEVITVIEFPLEQLVEMIKHGEIKDSKTIIAILLVYLKRREKCE